MKRKPTKGPWIVNSSAVKANWPGTGDNIITICEVNHISFADGKKAPHDEQTANLFLIAAAPDLRDALNELLQFVEMGEFPSQDEAIRKAMRAIEKSKSA